MGKQKKGKPEPRELSGNYMVKPRKSLKNKLPFHGGNPGSNPGGDANKAIKYLAIYPVIPPLLGRNAATRSTLQKHSKTLISLDRLGNYPGTANFRFRGAA